MEQLAGTEFAIEAGAADLEQEIGTAAGTSASAGICEGFKGRVAAYIERIQFRREAPWTRSARTARVSI